MPTITVLGATGLQGGSVINSVLAHPTLSKTYTLRGVSRDPSKPSGQALAKKGVEVVKGDLGDKDSLIEALKGSDAVFAVTDYWASLKKDVEIQQGKNIADAAKEVGVKHLVWSTLTNVTKASGGKLPNVYHFDGKAEIEDYIRSLGIPMTSFVPGFYISNIKSGMMNKGEDGVYTLAFPFPADTKIPTFDAGNDTGCFVAPIFANPDKYIGGRILGASAHYTPEEYVKAFEEVSGQKGRYVQVSAEDYKKSLTSAGFPEYVAQEMLENMYLISDYGYFGGDDEKHLKETFDTLEFTEKPSTIKESIEKLWPW